MKALFVSFVVFLLSACSENDSGEKYWYSDIEFEHPAMKKCLIGWIHEYGYEKVEDVTELFCSRNGIDSIAGIEQLYNLKEFGLSYVALTELALPGNPNLESINIGFSPYLKSVDLSHNQQLKVIFLNYNAIEHVNLSNLPDLRVVDLTTNMLKEISLSGTDVQHLNLSGNLLEELHFDGVRNISDLRVDGNPLVKLELSNLFELTSLFMRDTDISELDLTNNYELSGLVANNSNITSIRFDSNPKMNAVHLLDNPLDENTIKYLDTIDWIPILHY
ncbi:leucine-rich repeat domain-containing protein [Shewanella gaetbuli]